MWKAACRMPYPFGPAVRLLIATGQRREEVGQLAWSELDLDAALWTMPAARNKGGRQHVVPLSALALEALEACPKVGKHVFTTTGTTAVSGWSKCKVVLDRIVAEERGAPLAPWVLHDLRRTCASRFVALGVRPDVVEAVLGHAHPGGSQLASVYQRHSYQPEMRAALDAGRGTSRACSVRSTTNVRDCGGRPSRASSCPSIQTPACSCSGSRSEEN